MRSRILIGGAVAIALVADTAIACQTEPRKAAAPAMSSPAKPVIAPAGAPYTYQMPTGWVPAKRDATPPGRLTSVGPPLGTEHSNAVVSVEVMHPGSEPQARNLSEISRLDPAAQPTGDGWTVATVDTPAGRARQVTYRAAKDPGGRYYFYDRPAGGPVFVLCQWRFATSADEALRGCDEVVQSLAITG